VVKGIKRLELKTERTGSILQKDSRVLSAEARDEKEGGDPRSGECLLNRHRIDRRKN